MFHKKGRYVLPIFGTKGQVTIFIIIGILILAAFTVIYYFTSLTKTASLEVEQTRFVSNTPEAFEPIKLYTENCLSQVGERGVRLLGEQGGYIYPDLVGKFSLSNPTEFDGLYLDPIKVPYWYYNKQPNSGSTISIASLRPALYTSEDDVLSVEAQMRRYVSEKVGECLQGYKPFVDQGFEVVEQGSIEPVVLVRDHDVLVRMGMPLKLQKGESTAEFSQFVVSLPVELKRYYELAQNISTTQQEHTFLENVALNLVQIYSGVNEKKLPPTTASEFDNKITFWQTSQVKEKFQQMLSSNVPQIRFYDADNFYRKQYPQSTLSGLYQRSSDDMILPLSGAQGLDVRFDYFNWDIFMDINEGQQLIQPAGYKFTNPVGLIPFNLQFQNYYNTYDFSYPVEVTITDQKAFGGKGYNFVIALEGTVVNNRPAYADQIEPAPVSTKSSLVCDPDKRNTQLLRSIVVDAATQKPLEAVQIGFQIPEQDYCYMGTTDTEGSLVTKYPAVYGGVLDFTREGYLTNFYPIDTYPYKKTSAVIGYAAGEGVVGNNPVIELYPFKMINVSIKQKPLVKCIGSLCPSLGPFSSEDALISYKPQLLSKRHYWVFPGVPKSLTPDETGVVIFTRVADLYSQVRQDDFTAFATVTGSQISPVRLVPGVYEVTGLVTTKQEIVIPKEERCDDGIGQKIACTDLDGCCFTLDEIKLNEFELGSLEWNDEKTYLTITADQLYGNEQMTFYIPTFDLPGVPEQEHMRVIEDLNVLNQLNNVSKIMRGSLEPVYR